MGDTITFTVTLSNSGPNTASNVVGDRPAAGGAGVRVGRPEPGDLRSHDRAVERGDGRDIDPADAGDPGDGPRARRAEEPPADPHLRQFKPSSHRWRQTNTATITHADQFDPNPGNTTASATETPQQADLVLSKSVDNPTPNVGDTITYTITLSDNGPDSATDVVVSDLLPSGLLFLDATASEGIYDPLAGLWTVGTVVTTVPQTLLIRAEVISPGSTVNTATITHADQFDPNTANNTATTTEDPEQADLSVTKTVDDSTPNVGETITYTVTLTNNGPAYATSVTVQDSLPAGLGLVDAVPGQGQGTYNPATGLWSTGYLSIGESAVLTIRAMVDSPDPQTNTATITSSAQFDPNPGNNTATSVVTPQQADLFVTKTVNDATPNVGDTVSFIVTVGDNGPGDATGVAVQDPLPAGLTFDSATATAGSYDSTSGTWNVGAVHPRRGAGTHDSGDGLEPESHGEYRDDHPRRSVRPRIGQQCRPSRLDTPASRPGADQERQHVDSQRGRRRDVYGRADGQRPERRHRCPGD